MPKKSPTPAQIELQPEDQYCESILDLTLCMSDAEFLVEYGSIEFPTRHQAYSCADHLPDVVALALQILGNEIEPTTNEPYSVRVAAYTPGQPILPKPILADNEVTLDTTDSLTVRMPNSDVDN